VSGDARSLLSEYRSYNESLFQFSIDHDLGIFDAGHEELWRAADAANLMYKPCGAGGGDIGIVLGLDEVALTAFLDNLPRQYTILDCKLSADGVRIDRATAE
jgi:phosphomevalonate kinase